MKNIEQFDMVTVRLFARLYEQFPKKLFLDCVGLCDGELFEGLDDEQKGEFCAAAVEFLRENGFVVFYDKSGSSYASVGLTMKGLTTLKQTPKSIKNSKTIGEELVSAAKKGGVEFTVALAKNALSQILGVDAK